MENNKVSERQIRKHFGSLNELKTLAIDIHPNLMPKKVAPKVLIFDIETAPIEAFVWGLWDNNVALNQIKKDWFVLSWAAKWLHESKMMYMDQSKVKDKSNDKELLKGIWELLNEADIVITQNGKNFDEKKLKARFILNKMKPPSSFKHIDICKITKRTFGFTSHKLEYMTNKLCTKYKKLKSKKFQGQDLWTECLKNNQSAWKEMELYNKYDVLSLEELYDIVIPWDNSINFNIYNDAIENVCKCGSKKFTTDDFYYTNLGKFQRYKCTNCGAESRDRENLFSKEKIKSIRIK